MRPNKLSNAHPTESTVFEPVHFRDAVAFFERRLVKIITDLAVGDVIILLWHDEGRNGALDG